MGANSEFYYPRGYEKSIPVSFVGQACRDRPEFIAFLQEKGVPAHVWGPNWRISFFKRPRKAALNVIVPAPTFGSMSDFTPKADTKFRHGPVDDNEMLEIVDRPYGGKPWSFKTRQGQRRRQAEQAGASARFRSHHDRGFYLTEAYETLSTFFDVGREIETFATAEELEGKISYYLIHDSERERIREAGRRRALLAHNWERRFSLLFDQRGLS